MNTTETLSFNNQLRLERIRRNWRQQDLADELGTTVTSVKRWERGSQQPSVYFRVKLCTLFDRSAEEFGLATERSQSTHMPKSPVQDEALSASSSSSSAAAEIQTTLICGAIQAMAHFFPSNELDGEDWRRSEQLLPHALICIHQSEQHGYLFPESITLLTKVAAYLLDRARFCDAEPLLQKALQIREQTQGAAHLDTAYIVNDSANLYRRQGKYAQAEPLFLDVLYIEERHLDTEHPEIATTLHNLALLYIEQGKYEHAEPLFQRALAIRQKSLGPQHPDVAKTLSCLTNVHQMQQHTTLKTFSYDQQTRAVSNDVAFAVEQRRDERPTCPGCEQADEVVCSGANRAGTQRFRCRSCQRYFTPSTRQRGYHPSLKTQALALAEEGMSARTIAQKLEVHHSTVSLWIKQCHLLERQ